MMHEDIERHEDRLFDLGVAAMQFQCVFGAIALVALLFASIVVGSMASLGCALIACALQVFSQGQSAKASMEGIANPISLVETAPRRVRIATILWYACVVFAILSFLFLL